VRRQELGSFVGKEWHGLLFHEFRRSAARNFVRAGVKSESCKGRSQVTNPYLLTATKSRLRRTWLKQREATGKPYESKTASRI